MNKLIALLTCAVLFCATNFLAGCKGPGKSAAYKTLKAVGTTVDSAMKAYADAVVIGLVDQATQTKVRNLHEQYRVAFLKAVAAAEFDYETASPAEVAGLASELVALAATYATGGR